MHLIALHLRQKTDVTYKCLTQQGIIRPVCEHLKVIIRQMTNKKATFTLAQAQHSASPDLLVSRYLYLAKSVRIKETDQRIALEGASCEQVIHCIRIARIGSSPTYTKVRTALSSSQHIPVPHQSSTAQLAKVMAPGFSI